MCADGHTSTRVGVQHTACVLAHGVDATVDGEACGVDGEGRVAELVAVLVDLDQAAGGDFVKHQAIGVDQKMMLGAGDARRHMREDQVAPAIGGHQAVAGSEVNAKLPFFGADNFLE